jgi:threonine synthase
VETVPIPARDESRRGEDEEDPVSVVTSQAESPARAPSKKQLREGAFGHATALSCRECGHRIDLGPHYACPECFGPLEIAYDFPAISAEEIEAGPRNIWRYKALLPVPHDIEGSPNTEPGFTRLLKAHNLGRELGIENLWVKDDSTNPTNSFKDRVVACALSAAREFGSSVFACPSTGNLANAVAAAGARAGIKTVVFIPSDLEKPKQVNSAVYTDSLVAVNGTSVPTTPRAPRPWASRSPSSSAGACPTRS